MKVKKATLNLNTPEKQMRETPKDGKFTYGPIVWSTYTYPEGNYLYGGKQPVAYDEMGIPIDEDGLQCLSHNCILHPHYKGLMEYNDVVNAQIPQLDFARSWFETNYLKVSDDELKNFILGNLLKKHELQLNMQRLVKACGYDKEKLKKLIWK